MAELKLIYVDKMGPRIVRKTGLLKMMTNGVSRKEINTITYIEQSCHVHIFCMNLTNTQFLCGLAIKAYISFMVRGRWQKYSPIQNTVLVLPNFRVLYECHLLSCFIFLFFFDHHMQWPSKPVEEMAFGRRIVVIIVNINIRLGAITLGNDDH